MKILLECFVDIESGPVFTLGFAKGLKHNGVDVYALLKNTCENIDEWRALLDESHLYVLQTPLIMKKYPLKAIFELYRIKKKFNNVEFDFYIDTFPIAMSRFVSRVLKYKYTIGIDHDVIPHSSATEFATNRVKHNIAKMDFVLILSKSFTNIAADKYGISTKRILYMRHSAMEYPVIKESIYFNNAKKVTFLFFGRIDGYKGLHILAKAYFGLSLKYNEISLVVAGGGDFSEYKEEYEQLPNCTVVNRYLDNSDIAYYFSKPNTVVVLPYLDASQSGVLGMAFQYKTPVIVSDTGGLKEQLFDGEMGIFTIPGDAEDLQDKMELFISDTELYIKQQKLMEIGYKKSTWDYVVKEFLEQLAFVKSAN